MFNLKTKTIIATAFIITLAGCSTTPKPPSCTGELESLKPVTPEMLTNEQIGVIKDAHRHDENGGHIQ